MQVQSYNDMSTAGDDDNDISKHMNAVVRLLQVLGQAGDEGMHTRALLKALKSTRYGQQTIRIAEKHGYIKRVRDIEPKGKGNYLVMNYLTARGKRFLKSFLPPTDDNP
jgi:hypothetical protein